ncbi:MULTISPECIES: RICIN domain-containing protein [unclassified Leifsonia]|uniref:RICIN domain-containing protein n=1 Tax=unclassified Leifsonia TaxID=2663824 RepID=UPI0008A80481|nr:MULTISPECIES: RICIN domain-containing protein [unclassified Leifsonia]SEI14672.1 glucosylceramidase [Leifsonia sp. CL154]SFM02379.1 glucosylceramidase [Leifsonia sp. CL147]
MHRPRPRRRRALFASSLAIASIAASAAIGTAAVAPANAALPTVQAWLTTTDGTTNLQRQSDVTFGPVTQGSLNISVSDNRTYQTMVGYGAAFTDSSAYLAQALKSYSSTQYSSMMNQVFSSSGDALSFWRVPMGASDFNAAPVMWTDADTQGPSTNPLQNFALTTYDTARIIPTIKDALAINPDLKLVASAWSAPAWMKSNRSMICNTGSGPATLLPQYYQAWADYYVKWIQAYQAQGVPIWAITPQNEPQYCPTTYPGMSWDEPTMASWVHNYLKPDLVAAGLNQPILGYDFNWENLAYPTSLISGSAASDYSGVAWHCYDYTAEPAMMTNLHNVYGYDQYETECSSDSHPNNIIAYTTAQMATLSAQNWAKGSILWNFALDSTGGPCLGCNLAAPAVPVVQINATVNGSGTVTSASYTMHNNFYQLGQFSHFVNVGATRIAATANAGGIVASAYKNPDGSEVVVATNPNSSSTSFTTTWNGQGSFSYTLPAGATVTFTGNVPAAPALRSTPVSGQTYLLVSRTSGKVLGISGASSSNGALAVSYTDDNSPDQQWTLTASGSAYVLTNTNSGKVLDDPGSSTSNGTQLQQWSAGGTANQLWAITSAGAGYYTLTNQASGLVLDLQNGGLGDGTPVQQWAGGSGNPNQQWQLIAVPRTVQPTSPAVGQRYRIESVVSGKPVAVDGASTSDGAAVIQWADDAATDQVWTVIDAGSGYVNLVNLNSGKALDNPGGSTANGTGMTQYAITGTGNANQQWTITAAGGGYTITNRASGKSLDLMAGNTDDGTVIQQWATTGGDANQQFVFAPAG